MTPPGQLSEVVEGGRPDLCPTSPGGLHDPGLTSEAERRMVATFSYVLNTSLQTQGFAEACMVPERRRHSRVRVGSLIPVDLGSDNGGIVVDLSEGGFRVRVVGRLETDRVVPVELPLYGRSLRIEATGQVAWVDESGRAGGVRFVHLPERSHRQVKQWLAQNSPTSDIQEEEPATRREAIEAEPPTSAAAQRDVTHWVPSWAADEPIAQEQNQVPVSSYSFAGPPRLDSAQSGTASPASEYTYVPETDDEAVKEDRPVPLQPSELREPWLRYYSQYPIPSHDPQRRHKLIVRVAAGGVIVLALIISAALLHPHRKRVGELFGELRQLVVGEIFPSEADQPPDATTGTAKSRLHRRRPGKTKGQLAGGGEFSGPGAAGLPRDESTPSKPNASQLEVLEMSGQRRVVELRRGPILRLRDWTTTARIQARRRDSTEAHATSPESVSAGSLAAPERGGSQEISGKVPEQHEMPTYPVLALQNDVQGKVVLRAVIGKDGTVQDVQLISGPLLLTSAVMDAVHKWRYKPYYQDGEPVAVETQITVEFRISMK